MAKCPNCKQRLNFWKTISLSRYSNRMLCTSCNKVLEANKSTLGIFGGTSIAILILIYQNSENWFGIENPLLALGIASVIFVLLVVFFFYQIKLRVSNNQDKTDFEDNFVLKERPKLPENHTRTEYLKNSFYDKSDSELKTITIDPNRIPEAREAAKQLLTERRNVT